MFSVFIIALSMLQSHNTALVNTVQAKLQIFGEDEGYVLGWEKVY